MRVAIICLTVSSLLLAGCHPEAPIPSIDGKPTAGRFAGIGVYETGRIWQQLAAQDPKDPTMAKLADDEHIIVVVDSHTGEVRQCGDHSGYCVAMNPWVGQLPANLPAHLVKHAADLDAEQEEATKQAMSRSAHK